MKQYTNKQCDKPCLLFSSLSVYRNLHYYEGEGNVSKGQQGNVSPARHLPWKNSVSKRHCVTIPKDFKDDIHER